MKKILVLHNIISPARIHLFNELNKHYHNNESTLKVFFLSKSDKNRYWKDFNIRFDYEILKNFAIRIGKKDLFTFFINPNILSALSHNNPDKIICFGWDHFAAYAANWWARKNKKEFILWSGSTKYEPSWRRTIFSPLVKYLFKNTDKFVVYGTRARDYIISLGVNPKNIEIIFNSIDIDYFKEKTKNLTRTEKKLITNKLGIKTSKIILFNGQLIERKGIYNLLEGFKDYHTYDPDVSLLIIGRGREKEKMKRIIKKMHLKDIIFTDFIQYDDLYKYYSISNLLILPSYEEVWGLVINEAMACDLPVIATKEAGASADLIEDGKNGYIIKSANSKEITKAIKNVFENNLHLKNDSWGIIQKTKTAANIIKSTLL